MTERTERAGVHAENDEPGWRVIESSGKHHKGLSARGQIEHAATADQLCAKRAQLFCWATPCQARKPIAIPYGEAILSRIPSLTSVVLLVSVTLTLAAAAQQAAPQPVVRPAPAPEVPAEHAASPPIVVPAEQVAPMELTGLLGHAVADSEGREFGRIVDLLADGQGRVRAVVVDVGGFMGVGNRKVAVAWSALRFAGGEKGPVMSIAIPPDRIKSWADYIAGRPVAILGAPDSSP